MKSSRRLFMTAAAAGSVAPLSALPLPSPQAPAAPESRRFRDAVIAGEIEVVKQLAAHDPALTWSRDEHGVSVYTLACLNRRKDVAEWLASQGLVLDLFEASAGGQLARVQELIKSDQGLVHLRSANGRTAMHFAAGAGQAPVVIFLNGAGADLSAGPESPLVIALDGAEPAAAQSIANILLVNASNPNAGRADGVTALHLAALKGYGDTARLLIHRGADPAARDSRGRTPLDVATGEAIPVLRQAASIERAYYGRRYVRPLEDTGIPQALINEFVTVAHNNPERVKQLLKIAPALVHTRAPWDETGIEGAAHMGLTPLARLLADSGAQVSTCTAALLGETAIVRRNLDDDPRSIHERGAHDLPLLAYTAYDQPRVEVAELLLSKGADVSVRAFNQTVLHLCALKGHADLARLLLDHGADVNSPWQTKDGSATPLAVAIRNKQDSVAELLRSRGGRV